jgi:RimJ/RimL family protein N-acetyltransferase
MQIIRYDPRKDKQGLIDLAKSFADRSYEPFNEAVFTKEIEQRVMDLKLRNSIILAKEGDKIVGAGMFSLFNDIWGNQHCMVYQIMTNKEDAFKKGIEDSVMKEIFKYLKNTMNVDKIGLYCQESDSQYRSVLMKLGIEKSKFIFYEHKL